MRCLCICCVAILLGTASVYADLFTNLKFENYTNPTPPPGWEITSGYWAELNQTPISSAAVCMIDSDNSIGAPVVEGVYSIYLSAGFAPDFSLPQVGISQTAEVPTGITYLAFTTRNVHTNLVIYTYLLGGVDLLQEPPTDIGGGLLRYSTDVSAFAGTTQTLQFAVQSRDSGAYGHVIDDIQFVIPEPQMLSLLIVGGSLIAYLRRRL